MFVVAHADWQRTTLLLYYLSTPTQKQQQSNNKATTPPNKNNNHWRLINKDHDIRLYNSWLSPSHVRVITMLHLLWNLNFNITTPSALMHKNVSACSACCDCENLSLQVEFALSWLSPSHVHVITSLHLILNLIFSITTRSALMRKSVSVCSTCCNCKNLTLQVEFALSVQ